MKFEPAYRPYIAMLQEHNVRAGFFEADQFAAVKGKSPAALQAVAEFAHLTGWRVHSEVLPLKWRNVDLKAGTVSLDVGSTKNGEVRTIYLTAALRDAPGGRRPPLRTLAKAQETITPRLFHRHGKPLRRFYKGWRKACASASCPGKLLHDFQRTAVRNYVRAGIPERVAMAMSGHKTRSVFDRYDIVTPTDLQAAAARLDQTVTGTNAGTISVGATVTPIASGRK